MSHSIVHIELSANGHKEAANFYSTVFGWDTTEFPGQDYTTFVSGEGAPGGGFNPVQEGNPAGTTIIYIETDDIAGSVAKIEANGGKMVSPTIDIPSVGTIQHFVDPTGNHMSLLKPDESYS